MTRPVDARDTETLLAEEREACAKIAEQYHTREQSWTVRVAAKSIARQIRARSGSLPQEGRTR